MKVWWLRRPPAIFCGPAERSICPARIPLAIDVNPARIPGLRFSYTPVTMGVLDLGWGWSRFQDTVQRSSEPVEERAFGGVRYAVWVAQFDGISYPNNPVLRLRRCAEPWKGALATAPE